MATFRQLAARCDLVVMAGDTFTMTLRFTAGGIPIDVSGTHEAMADDGSTFTVDDTKAATGELLVTGTVTAAARRWQLDWTEPGSKLQTLTSGKVTAREWLPV